MEFKTVQDSFNFYNSQSLGAIETRAKEIKSILDTNPEADINALSIEFEGLEKAQANLKEKRSKISTFNPLFGETTNNTNEEEVTDVIATPEYRSAFYKSLLGKEMNASEERALKQAKMEKRAEPFNTATNNANVIPTLTLNEVISKVTELGGILPHVRQFAIPSNVALPVAEPLTMAEWHTEGEEVQGEQVTPAKVEFSAYEIIKVFSQSVKARKMSIQAFESWIVDQLVKSVMATIENSLINGNGDSKGLASIKFNSTNSVTLSNDPSYTDFTSAMAKLKRGYSMGAKWVMNNATLYNLVYGVVDANKRPIFISDPKNESIGHILGHEVVIDDFMEDNEIILGNLNYLGYNLPEGIALEVSDQSSFTRGLIDYRALAIADTQVILPDAFVKLSAGSSI